MNHSWPICRRRSLKHKSNILLMGVICGFISFIKFYFVSYNRNILLGVHACKSNSRVWKLKRARVAVPTTSCSHAKWRGSGSAFRQSGPATSRPAWRWKLDIDSLSGDGPFFPFAADKSAKHEESGCNGNPLETGSVRIKGRREGAGNICRWLHNLHFITAGPLRFA